MSGHTYTHIHTHRTTTVTLAAHVRRGLTIQVQEYQEYNQIYIKFMHYEASLSKYSTVQCKCHYSTLEREEKEKSRMEV